MINLDYLHNLKDYESDLNLKDLAFGDCLDDMYSPGYFPAYIVKKDLYPFVFNRSLTIESTINGVITKNFSGPDNAETYAKNLIEQPSDWIYRTLPIFYNVNSLGYRTKEFSEIVDWKNTIPVFGCSCVFGTGLAEQHTITGNLEQNTDKQAINFGYPSSSNELILLNLINFIDYVGIDNLPKNIVIMWSSTDRMVFYNRDICSVGPWSLTHPDSEVYRYLVASVENPINELMKQYHISEVVKKLFLGRSNLITASFFPTTAKYMRCDLPLRHIPWDHARDGLHPGINAVKLVSDYILEKLV